MGAFICLVGAILQASARNLTMILVGRIIAGWAVGLMSMSVAVYQAECAHPKIRGLIVGLAQQMIGVGFIVRYGIILWFLGIEAADDWSQYVSGLWLRPCSEFERSAMAIPVGLPSCPSLGFVRRHDLVPRIPTIPNRNRP